LPQSQFGEPPPPEDWPKRLFTPFPTREFCKALVLVEVATDQHKQSRAHLVKYTTSRPGTKHCPQQAKRASVDDWPEGKSGQGKIADHTQHTLETLPEVPGPGEQGTLHSRVHRPSSS